MSESAARITLSAKGLIMKIVGDVLIIETSDPDELRREVNRALGDEPLTVQGAAGYLKVSTRTKCLISPKKQGLFTMTFGRH